MLLTVCGCGKNSEIEEYRTSMDEYYQEASACNDAINNIDPSADDAGDQLLKQLDTLNDATQKMAALSVPKQFGSVETLADDAATYMDKAVTLYHQAYSAQPYDPNLADEGRQYYERANKRIAYILLILHGEAPSAESGASGTETSVSGSTAQSKSADQSTSAADTEVSSTAAQN